MYMQACTHKYTHTHRAVGARRVTAFQQLGFNYHPVHRTAPLSAVFLEEVEGNAFVRDLWENGTRGPSLSGNDGRQDSIPFPDNPSLIVFPVCNTFVLQRQPPWSHVINHLYLFKAEKEPKADGQ